MSLKQPFFLGFCVLFHCLVNAQKFQVIPFSKFDFSETKGISKTLVSELQQFIKDRDSEILLCSDCSENIDKSYRKIFRSKLTQKQFTGLIANQINAFTEKPINKTFDLLKGSYTLNAEQANTLKELVTKNIKNTFSTYQYNLYNKVLSNRELNYDNAVSNLQYFELLSSFKNSKITYVNTSHPNLKGLVDRAKAAFIPDSKINSLIQLFLENEVEKNNYHLEFEQWKDEYVFYMHPNEYNPNTIRKAFSKKLIDLFTFDEFTALFKAPLSKRLNRANTKAWNSLLSKHNIPEKYHTSLKAITDYYSEQKIITSEYYNYNPGVNHTKMNELIAKEKEAIHKALVGFNLIEKKGAVGNSKPESKPEYSDKRIPYLVQRARNAGVAEDKIATIVRAIEVKQKEDKIYNDNFYAWSKKNIVYYHDSSKGKHNTEKDMKRRIASQLTIEQFGQIFGSQFQDRIERKTTDRFKQVLYAYENLPKDKYSVIKELLKEQITNEVITFSYYSYDHKYAVQKIKTLEYKFNRKLKEKINNLTK